MVSPSSRCLVDSGESGVPTSWINGALISGVPIVGIALLLANLSQFQVDWKFRLFIFLLYFGLSLTSQIGGLLVICLTAGWWEVPTLLLGMPNQFAIEIGILGFLVAALVHRRKNSLNVVANCPSIIVSHPVGIATIFCIVYSLIAFAVSLGQYKALSFGNFSTNAFLSDLSRRIFWWDVRESPVHGLSILWGYLLHTSFMLNVVDIAYRANLSQIGINQFAHKIVTALSVGMCLPYVTALSQISYPDQLLAKYSVQFGGTFQNGNHLAVASGITALLGIDAILDRRDKLKHKALLSIMTLLSIIALFLGDGRTGQVAFTIGFACLALLKVSRLNRLLVRFPFSAALLFVCLYALGICLVVFIHNGAVSSRMSEIDNLISRLANETLYASGRQVPFEIGQEMLHRYMWFGIGLGNFLPKSGLPVDLHNGFQSWAVELGFPALVLLLLTCCNAFRIQCASKSFSLLTSLLIFGAMVSTTDNPFSYRSLALIYFLPISLICLGVPPKVEHHRIVYGTIILGVIYGLLTTILPHSRFDSTTSLKFNVSGKPMTQIGGSGPIIRQCRESLIEINSGQKLIQFKILREGKKIDSFAPTPVELFSSIDSANFEQAGLTLPGRGRKMTVCLCIDGNENDDPIVLNLVALPLSIDSWQRHDSGELGVYPKLKTMRNDNVPYHAPPEARAHLSCDYFIE